MVQPGFSLGIPPVIDPSLGLFCLVFSERIYAKKGMKLAEVEDN